MTGASGPDPEENGAEIERVKQEIGYTSRLFVQALFPYRKREHKELRSQTGPLTVTLYSSQGLPYGKYPRLIMAYMLTEAVKRSKMDDQDEARKIPLGSSLNEFMGTMGLKSRGSGGARGTVTLLREQLRRLMGTMIIVESATTPNPETAQAMGRNIAVASSWALWFHPNADQPTLEASYIELSPEFYKFLLDRPVPIDLEVLRKLDKPRAMDLYIWLTFRKYPINKPMTYDWDELQNLFGPDTSTENKHARYSFKRELGAALETVKDAWPGVGAELGPEGLTLTPGEPSIPRKSPRRNSLS